MSWHFVERWLQKVNQHSTLIGKFWITFLIVFRIVVVSSVGDRVYSDEQSEFKCNIQQIGCPNVCFNKFSPISHIRFWSFQIIMVTTPSIIFMVYSAHEIKKKAGKEKASSNNSNNSPTSPEKMVKPVLALDAAQLKTCLSDEDNSKKKNRRRKSQFQDQAPEPLVAKKSGKKKDKDMSEEEKAGFSQHYALYTTSVLLRTFVEVFFILLQYKFFGFHVPELYKCVGFPCPNVVDCFSSRPMEKTIFLWFMFVIAVVSLALNIMEIYYLFWQWSIRKSKQEKRKRKMRPYDEVQDITIHDAEFVEGDIIAPRAPPPEYGGISRDVVEGADMLKAIDFVRDTAPIAVNVNMDDAVITEHLKNGQNINNFVGTSAPSRFAELLTPSTSIDQPYANLQQDRRTVGRGRRKGNDYYDYV